MAIRTTWDITMNLNTTYPKTTMLGTVVTHKTYLRLQSEIAEELRGMSPIEQMACADRVALKVVFKATWPEVVASLAVQLVWPIVTYLIAHTALSLAVGPTLTSII